MLPAHGFALARLLLASVVLSSEATDPSVSSSSLRSLTAYSVRAMARTAPARARKGRSVNKNSTAVTESRDEVIEVTTTIDPSLLRKRKGNRLRLQTNKVSHARPLTFKSFPMPMAPVQMLSVKLLCAMKILLLLPSRQRSASVRMPMSLSFYTHRGLQVARPAGL
jgi:hypothetical protein